jgi:dihydrofolate reductase
MRKIIAATFMSLDGVMQAPGGPDEDLSGNFKLGGWTFAYGDADMDLSAAGFDGKDRELLLGRKTYELFASYWPRQSEDNPIAKRFNATKKHVASRTLKTLEWNNSSLLGGDIVPALTALKAQPGDDLQIIGSGNLIQTLQAASLIDEYNVWTYPVVLGRGKRLFENGAKPGALRLVASKTSITGVLMSRYVPAGEIILGVVGEPEASAQN